MRASTVTWPPAYGAATTSGNPAPQMGSGFPPASWPSRDQLEYVRALITALLLVLALPWLSYTLATRPAIVLRGAAQRQIRPAT